MPGGGVLPRGADGALEPAGAQPQQILLDDIRVNRGAN